jgi:transposase-like protein
MGGESAEAWRTVLDDLIARGLRQPEFLIVDGAPGPLSAACSRPNPQLHLIKHPDQDRE